ncbi:MAG: PilZ domain-containing protein [Deltaproteobacteria bacterium]|nr:PilZ domain-containing protein [Deltaproteobacteria bacterium]MBW2043074.1 PilZ domain-containing protein [Deltaproteobacteria bacterium]MBW2133422.1 PilZ domain-containing protein [Deltaproteobacteria bacterium]
MDHRDERKYVRLIVSRAVEFMVSGRRYYGVISSESDGGVFIETRGRFHQGQEIRLDYLSPQGIQIQKTGEIVRVTTDGIAVRFRHPGYAR